MSLESASQSSSRPRLLLVSMYPLDAQPSGPAVRISHLRDELSELVHLDVIDGYRGPRRARLARYVSAGRLRRLAGIYVETSTFLPAEADVVFLGLARALGIPVLTYIRDAYQLFDEYYRADTPRRWLGKRAFRPFLRALGAVSSRLAFPTAGLAAAAGYDPRSVALLPPGSPRRVDVRRAADADQLLYVGDARWPAQGVARLIEAVGMARDRGTAVGLTVVSAPDQAPPGPHPPWLSLRAGHEAQIHALLPDVVATVIPRLRSPYNDLALPIKLFEYLAYGRPLLVTDCTEQARVVSGAECGVVVGDAVEELAEGVLRVATAPAATVEGWSRNAIAAAEEASWRSRAERIVALLTEADTRAPRG